MHCASLHIDKNYSNLIQFAIRLLSDVNNIKYQAFFTFFIQRLTGTRSGIAAELTAHIKTAFVTFVRWRRPIITQINTCPNDVSLVLRVYCVSVLLGAGAYLCGINK